MTDWEYVFGGGMHSDDHFDINTEEQSRYAPPLYVTCRYCQTTGLEWEKHDGKWRLVDGTDQVHNCRAVATEGDFECLDFNQETKA